MEQFCQVRLTRLCARIHANDDRTRAVQFILIGLPGLPEVHGEGHIYRRRQERIRGAESIAGAPPRNARSLATV